MSSTSVAAAIPTSPAAQTPSQIRSRTITPTTTPVTLLPEPAARAYTHIHPVVVLALYRLRFSNLVADPVPELLRALAALAMLQVGYVVTCLPPTNGRAGRVSEATRSGKVDSKSKSTKRDNRARSVASLSSRITTALLSLPLALFPGTVLLYALLVLFGAPLTTHHAHTILLAAHMSLLAIFPLCYAHGVDRRAWWEISAFMLPGDDVWGGAVGTMVGAWLGAIPIPLDWDREWQKWPVTILTGAYLGWVVGRLLGGLLLRGKRLNFDP